MQELNECDHAWETIGSTSFTGATYCQIKDVVYCTRCKRYAVRGRFYLDFHRIPQADVDAAVAEESEARRKLLAEHKAKVAGQEAQA